ncbi:MAG: hypothetical protein VW124_04270 [Paracoccaceae bacterium]
MDLDIGKLNTILRRIRHFVRPRTRVLKLFLRKQETSSETAATTHSSEVAAQKLSDADSFPSEKPIVKSNLPKVTFIKGPEAPTIVDMSSWQRPLHQNYSLDRSNWRAIQLADYENAEAEALRFLSIPALMAFKPASFQSVGWPTHVQCDEELVRYADHNFEAEVPELYYKGAEFAPIGYINAFSLQEAKLVNALRDQVAALTAERFGRSIRPMTNLMVQLGPFRCLEALTAEYGRKISVFEPGPGAGYLGALLAQNGYSYCSYDVTQSLYLWQSHLLDIATKGNFTELAGETDLSGIDRTSVLHMPWWIFALQVGQTPLRYDLVYSNSNLGEMTPIAFKQLMIYSKHVLADSEIGAFAFFSSGMTRYQTLESIDLGLRENGFVQIMEEPFYCYQLYGRDPAPILNAFKNGIPFIGGSKEDATLDANAVFATPEADAPIDTELSKLFHGWKPPLN